ncbi:MAG TPA: SurA N-terminal domain-containing protein, partial [Magnetospirillaceae bacterium]|nr:SurA N-terminal domain-containing protein [Magnetospirillaceae bacterium]
MPSPKQKADAPANGQKKDRERPTGKRTVTYVGTIIILAIVVVAFIFVPVFEGPSAEGQVPNFGSFAGKPIRYEQGGYMAQQVRAINDQIRGSGMTQMGDQFLAFQVWKGAFDRTVVHLALLHKARGEGILVTEDYLSEEFLEHPAFFEEGKFSLKRYRETPDLTRTS